MCAYVCASQFNTLVDFYSSEILQLFIKMGGCYAEFCNNSAAKGYSIKIFPTNPQRCTTCIWIQNVLYCI